MIIDHEQLKPYLKAGSDLVPLHVWNKQIKGKPRGKTPIHNDWTTKEYTRKEIKGRTKQGHNLGYRIGEFDLVIDLDPRRYGDEDIEEKLAELMGYFDFDEVLEDFPTVATGGGGYHIYCALPQDISYKELREELVDIFPGVEFKHKGKQVVAAGSKHPETGNFYEWVNQLGFSKNKKYIVPKSIIKLIKREIVERDYTVGAGSLNGDQLRDLFLDKLDPTEYDTNDSWFPLLCAAHHVTGGQGIDEFVEWCVDDLDYEDDENTIRSRWLSLDDNKESMYTVGTLIHELEKTGEDASGAKAVLNFAESGMVDFDDEDNRDEDEAEIIDTINDSDYDIDLEDVYHVSKKDHAGEPGAAIKFAQKLNPSSPDEEVQKALRLLKVAPEIEAARTLEIIQKVTKIPKSVLKTIIKGNEEQLNQDLSRLLAENTLKNVFNNNKHLMTLPSGAIFYYAKTHWKEISEDYLGKIIMMNLDKIKKKIDIKCSENMLIKQSQSFMRWYSAHNTDKLHSRKAIKPIINCKNGELWINQEGMHKLKPHSYKSALLQVLNVEYDPSAKCPLFMETITGIFENFEDTEELVRHMGEIMGYMIQPNKNLPNWWLFKGPGGDGKSTLVAILGGILGDSQKKATKKLLAALSDDTASSHTTTGLVGKLSVVIEELPAKYLVKDASLKMLSETTTMTADPKFGKEFPFVYCGSLIMCSNRFPSTSDISYGMQRRSNVIPFNRSFTLHQEEDINRVSKILGNKKEMAGVLNFMLEGLQRLRDRGNFKKPKSCIKITDEWFGVANPVVRFVKECIKKVDDDKSVPFAEVHSIYHQWCNENDLKPKAKMTLLQDLEDLKFTYGTGSHNSRRLYGAELILNEFDDLKDDEEW